MSKSDMKLKHDIEEELRWDPRVNSALIGVTVDKGVVSLLGVVDSYAEKLAAEEATKRVGGARAVAQELTVKIVGDHVRTDSEIAAALVSALRWDVRVPKQVTATVDQGRVTLQGNVTWNYQRDAAAHAVGYLAGVVHVTNAIALEPQVSVTAVREKVQAALQRQAAADAKTIRIETTGGKVTMTGHASSWQTIEDAANAAWAAPGVTEVIDQVKMQLTF